MSWAQCPHFSDSGHRQRVRLANHGTPKAPRGRPATSQFPRRRYAGAAGARAARQKEKTAPARLEDTNRSSTVNYTVRSIFITYYDGIHSTSAYSGPPCRTMKSTPPLPRATLAVEEIETFTVAATRPVLRMEYKNTCNSPGGVMQGRCGRLHRVSIHGSIPRVPTPRLNPFGTRRRTFLIDRLLTVKGDYLTHYTVERVGGMLSVSRPPSPDAGGLLVGRGSCHQTEGTQYVQFKPKRANVENPDSPSCSRGSRSTLTSRQD